MNSVRPYIDEVARALGVLAMLFLTFGHLQPLQLAYASDLKPYFLAVADDTALCGTTGQTDGQSVHQTPCQACRIGSSADLPLPPCSGEPAYAGFVHIAYAAPAERLAARLWPHIRGPRAPPAA